MSDDIHITRRAELDLLDAANYIDYILKNPDAADHLLDKTTEVISSLADYPQRINLVDDKILGAWGIRFIAVNNYLAFFVIDEKNNRVIIVRFLYGKRDWITILRQGFSLI